MKLSVKLTRKEIFNAYRKLFIKNNHFSKLSFAFSIVATVAIPFLVVFEICGYLGIHSGSSNILFINVPFYLFYIYCLFKGFRFYKVIPYMINVDALAKEMASDNSLGEFEIECNNLGFKHNDYVADNEDGVIYWMDVPGVETFENEVCIVVNPLLYQIDVENSDKPPTMLIILRKAFANTSYDFDHFKSFCENIINPTSSLTIQPEG